MSIFAVNHLCRETLRDHAFREAMRADPRAALNGLRLTEREREALVAGEVGELYAMGANAFLLGYLVRFGLLGLTIESYREKLLAAARAGAGRS
jgi:hypothetical protein